jgi:DNA-binding HxlR family transcriptional regulator
MDTAPRSGCAINAGVEVLGAPWSMLVLRYIVFGNRRYFRELVAGSEKGIAINLLASHLKRLVTGRMLARDADGGGHPRLQSTTAFFWTQSLSRSHFRSSSA